MSSALNEDYIISDYLNALGIKNGFLVDIGASNGFEMSNTYNLIKTGWGGLLVECDIGKFSSLMLLHASSYGVKFSNKKITPENLAKTLSANNVPHTFDFLSIDIDGYDYHVLDKLLSSGYRPKLVCAEINEKIPAPIRFSVKFHESYSWDTSHFYGMSISKVEELCQNYEYSLVKLHYNNAFFIPKELSPFSHISSQQAYLDGYINQSDRKQKFPWNKDMDFLLEMNPHDALHHINQKFSKYSGMYEAYL